MLKDFYKHKVIELNDDDFQYESIKVIYCDEFHLVIRHKIKDSADCVIKVVYK